MPAEIAADSTAAPPTPYIDNPKAQYMVMLVCNTATVRIDPLKVRLSDFNKRDFSIRSLMIKSLVLDNENTLLTVGNFENRDAAVDLF